MSRFDWFARVSVGGMLALGVMACGEEDDGGLVFRPAQPAYGGTGGAMGGTGGVMGGTGGAMGGTGGVVAGGTGGVVAGGTGGIDPGTGGVDPGTGGVDPGTGATGGEPVVPTPHDAFGGAITGGGNATEYFTFVMTVGGDYYNVQTNPWGGAVQNISAGGDYVFRVDSMQAPAGGQAWDVAAFPSVYKGTAQGGNPTHDSGMPIMVSDITAVPTGLSTNTTSINFSGNTTYDVYFTHSESFTGGPPDAFLMVWFDANAMNPINGDGEAWNCSSNPPTYIEACTGAGSFSIGGKTFHRFIGTQSTQNIISYVPEVPFDMWEFDLNAFIVDAVSQGVITSGMYLQSVQAGFEMIQGGAGLTVYDYYVSIQ